MQKNADPQMAAWGNFKSVSIPLDPILKCPDLQQYYKHVYSMVNQLLAL